MPETRTLVTVNGSPLSAQDLALVLNVTVEEALGSPAKASLTVAMRVDDRSGWTSPLDALVAPAVPFTVTVSRDGVSCIIDARSVSASWSISPGGLSTLTVEGLDRSVDLDRSDVQKVWHNTSDADIAREIFRKHQLTNTRIDPTPPAPNADIYSPQQSATDWTFLKSLADRNGFDLHLESGSDGVTAVFAKIDPTARPQTSTALALGYGDLGGNATASVQLLGGQEVHVTRAVPDTTDADVAVDRGTGHAMGSRSLGGATVVHIHATTGLTVLDAQRTATAMAERSAFGGSLSTTLTAPSMPLLRARGTVTVGGLGEPLDGLWLVRSVRHTITPGGHSQAVGLVRNALGSSGGTGAAVAALASAVGL
jgi:phage protein D